MQRTRALARERTTGLPLRGSFSMASLRTLFGGDENPGFGQTHKVGNVTQPLLYVCGKQDTAILCDRPYALATQQYCEGNYTFLDVRPVAPVSHARRVRRAHTA
jgi:hypothetical protein